MLLGSGPETSTTQRAPATGAERRSGYEHLAPLFAERGRLTDDDPRRGLLRAELITGYRPVAQHIARKYVYRGENPDDLEQVATLGLVLAVDRFEHDRGIDFLSFAVPTITGEVLRHFRDRSATIRLPRRLRELQGRIHDAAAELSQQLGRAARPSEIAVALGVGVDVVLDGLAAHGAGHTFSLDEPARDTDGQTDARTRFGVVLGHVEPEFDLVEYRESLEPLLAQLPERERTILILRFFGGLTQTEIGERIGLSQMHVSRVLSRTLALLRRRLTAD
ncbi:MAG: polymerase sigma-B factor [Pseudonocardiales bacterium]|nr:polymerase sigma-B factor [Pseudonocardiales bacterium]